MFIVKNLRRFFYFILCNPLFPILGLNLVPKIKKNFKQQTFLNSYHINSLKLRFFAPKNMYLDTPQVITFSKTIVVIVLVWQLNDNHVNVVVCTAI